MLIAGARHERVRKRGLDHDPNAFSGNPLTPESNGLSGMRGLSLRRLAAAVPNDSDAPAFTPRYFKAGTGWGPGDFESGTLRSSRVAVPR